MTTEYTINADMFLTEFHRSLQKESQQCSLLKSYTKYGQKKKETNENNNGSLTEWTQVMERIYCRIEDGFHKIYGPDSLGKLNLYIKKREVNSKIYDLRGEFQRIDATFFDERECIPKADLKRLGLNSSVNKIWNLRVALEHENSFTDQLHEVKQLLLVNAPLRVLVSYHGKTNDDSEFSNFIADYFNIFKLLERNVRMKQEDEFLMIFGNSGKSAITSGKITYRSVLIKYDSSGILTMEHRANIDIVDSISG